MRILKSKARLTGLVLTFCSIFLLPTILLPAPSQAKPKITFACLQKGGDYVTVARKDDLTSDPMITWKDKTWGEKYPPQKRCQIVSQRLTKAVATSGMLQNLNLTHGKVGANPVICYITSKSGKCNSENMLFSLKPTEIGQEKTIIDNLFNFSKKGTGESVVRGKNNKPQPTSTTYGDAIENALDAEKER
jgi:hypothetical protein